MQRNVMQIDVACRITKLRNVKSIVTVGRPLACGEGVFKAPELIETRHPEGLRIAGGTESHATFKRSLEDRQSLVGFEPNEKEFACLIGGKRDAQPLLVQP